MNALRSAFARHPLLMNVLWIVCIAMALVRLPIDMLTIDLAHAQDVWFGVVFTGWTAKLTEPLHWAIYAAGAWGFYRMRSCKWPWAALFCAQIAIGILVCNLTDARGGGWSGLGLAIPCLAVAAYLWCTRALFAAHAAAPANDPNWEST